MLTATHRIECLLIDIVLVPVHKRRRRRLYINGLFRCRNAECRRLHQPKFYLYTSSI